jgi:hypothetical protein
MGLPGGLWAFALVINTILRPTVPASGAGCDAVSCTYTELLIAFLHAT